MPRSNSLYGSLLTGDLRYNNVHLRGRYGVLRNPHFDARWNWSIVFVTRAEESVGQRITKNLSIRCDNRISRSPFTWIFFGNALHLREQFRSVKIWLRSTSW